MHLDLIHCFLHRSARFLRHAGRVDGYHADRLLPLARIDELVVGALVAHFLRDLVYRRILHVDAVVAASGREQRDRQ